MATASGKARTTFSRGSVLLRTLCLTAAAVALGSWHALALSQNYPSRAVRIVVPVPPGAAQDWLGRAIANALSAQWGTSVIVENRPGANAMIGTEHVARAEPDGYTLLLSTEDALTTTPHLMQLSFDPARSLIPVNLVAKISMIIFANADVPVDSLAGLIALARAKPKALNYGSYGSGSSVHLAMETLKLQAKIDIQHVPYKGVAPALTAVVSNEVQVALSGYVTVRGHVEAGRLKPLAVASTERVTQLPGVPTTRELGYSDVIAAPWFGIVAPAKTPAAIVGRINESLTRVLNDPEQRKQFEARGFQVMDIGPKAFQERVVRDSRSRADEVHRFGVKLD